ncbi:DUF1489 family protein [Futiania mangrovi]|uniref:DUF1489 domain-containing protein n=1 Tax=Futiania mangrovi TaxID=2959716 RepID=A0A9J6PC96_9PROT|nr:DUF1489 domain-containing protein [Futiania mangrovii]MCP1335235.1 DUF1489 domain-containing protein [Futiania mangrovii]
MTLHLQKLCVGAESIEDLAAWQAGGGRAIAQAKGYDTPVHTTRMSPKRVAELLDGGALYWIIKGQMRVRQPLLDICPVTREGQSACDLVLAADLIPVVPRRVRPFQGWRYLRAEDAPADLTGLAEGQAAFEDFPADLRQELAELALI